jgi:hypothetical protein
MSEDREQSAGHRDQRTDGRGPIASLGCWTMEKPEVRDRKPEVRLKEPQIGEQKADGREQRSER